MPDLLTLPLSVSDDYFLCRALRATVPASPARPVTKSNRVEGSGTSAAALALTVSDRSMLRVYVPGPRPTEVALKLPAAGLNIWLPAGDVAVNCWLRLNGSVSDATPTWPAATPGV